MWEQALEAKDKVFLNDGSLGDIVPVFATAEVGFVVEFAHLLVLNAKAAVVKPYD